MWTTRFSIKDFVSIGVDSPRFGRLLGAGEGCARARLENSIAHRTAMHRPLPAVILVFLAALGAFRPGRAAAQEAEWGRLAVRVVAVEDGAPIAAAVVRVDGAIRGATGDDGRFVIERVRPGRRRLEVSALAWRTGTPEVVVTAGGDVELEVRLVPAPLPLDTLDVFWEGPIPDRPARRPQDLLPHIDALRELYDRADSSGGIHILRDEIDRMNAVRFTDLLRNLPAVWIDETGAGPVVRLLPHSAWDPEGGRPLGDAGPRRPGLTGRTGCIPAYYLDGRPYPLTGSPDLFRPAEIEGIEVYVGEVPPHLPGPRRCGVVSVWRRPWTRGRPPPPGPAEPS